MNVLSLFSGIGGLDLASEWAGFRTVGFVERDPYCQRVLARHWPGVPIWDDVCQFRGERGSADIISGGFPCQPFSRAGLRRGQEDERNLWPEFARIVGEIRPAWVVAENVSGAIESVLDAACADLEALCYEVAPLVFPASAVGAEHNRERLFIVAHLASERMEGLRAGGEQVAHSLDKSLLPLRDSDGQWEVEPDVCRTPDGVRGRVDRLRALGNAVVPQQVYPIFKAIADAERAA